MKHMRKLDNLIKDGAKTIKNNWQEILLSTIISIMITVLVIALGLHKDTSGIAEWLSAIGTVGAVVVSLWLAIRADIKRPDITIEFAKCTLLGNESLDDKCEPIRYLEGESSISSIKILLHNYGDIETRVVEARLVLKNGGTVGLSTKDSQIIKGKSLQLIIFKPLAGVVMNKDNFDGFYIVIRDMENKLYRKKVVIDRDLTMELLGRK